MWEYACESLEEVCKFKQGGQCQKTPCGGDSEFVPIHRKTCLRPKMVPTPQSRNLEQGAGYVGDAPQAVSL